MKTYYCSKCARDANQKPDIDSSNVLGSTYQQDKFRKHTVADPTTSAPVRSVFDSDSSQYYEDCIKEALDFGFVEIDERERKQVIFCPSTQSSIGSKYKWGQLTDNADSVVVVDTSEGSKIHSFVENSARYSGHRCVKCGDPLF